MHGTGGTVGARVLVALLGVTAANGCDSSNDEGASSDPAVTGGDSGAAGDDAGGTGGRWHCSVVERAPDALTACQLIRSSCPATLDELLTRIEAEDSVSEYTVVEGDGLHELTTLVTQAVQTYTFDDDGNLVGFYLWNDQGFGPCAEATNFYEYGQLLRNSGTGHRCDLAVDAPVTGVLCDCPCPNPAPSNGAYDGGEACLSVAGGPCSATLVGERQKVMGVITEAVMRTGCGFTTIANDSRECSYDDAGDLVAWHGSYDSRDECPGVERFVSGEFPETCESETTCYLGSGQPPAGEMACPDAPG